MIKNNSTAKEEFIEIFSRRIFVIPVILSTVTLLVELTLYFSGMTMFPFTNDTTTIGFAMMAFGTIGLGIPALLVYLMKSNSKQKYGDSHHIF